MAFNKNFILVSLAVVIAITQFHSTDAASVKSLQNKLDKIKPASAKRSDVIANRVEEESISFVDHCLFACDACVCVKHLIHAVGARACSLSRHVICTRAGPGAAAAAADKMQVRGKKLEKKGAHVR